ncbi:MAG TPA: class I mannose-6-phosphate isomerase [Allosphingosinicella sp.]
MAAIRLERRPHERVWGRQELPPGFRDCARNGDPVGEIWFQNGARDALLVKYLFTSDRLSIQVHPDDAAAKAAGHPGGKDEAWLVIDAEPGAVIGLGLKRRISKARLREAALDGSIEQLIDWRPARAGDSFYSPAGTIHAIGGGLSLIEIQQNSDVTYRLYDYGRPRELHLAEAVAAARPAPLPNGSTTTEQAPGRRLLTPGGRFSVERWTLAGEHEIGAGGELLVIPLKRSGRIDGNSLRPGSVWRIDGQARLDGGVDLLAAYPGPPRDDLVRAAS